MLLTLIAVTLQQTKTATNMANPSIQANDLWDSSAFATSITIEATDATNRILIIKSYYNRCNILHQVFASIEWNKFLVGLKAFDYYHI